MVKMNEQVFRIGELKHKKLITLMQIIVAFFTALILGAAYSPIENIFWVPKIWIVLIGMLGAFLSLAWFSVVLTELEDALGWDKKLEEKRWTLWGSKEKDKKFNEFTKKYKGWVFAFIILELALLVLGVYPFFNPFSSLLSMLILLILLITLQFKL